MKRFACGMILFLSACLPMEKTKESSLRTSENLGSQNAVLVERTVQGERTPTTPNLTISGASNRVDVTVNPSPTQYKEFTKVNSSADQSATSLLSEKSRFSVSLPWGIALCAIALGITGITFAIRYALKSARASSVAVDQAFRTADDFAAEGIRHLRTKMNDASLTGKSAEAAAHAQSLAELESQRGKLKAKRPA